MRPFAALAVLAVLFNSVAAVKWIPTRTINVESRSNAASAPAPFVTVSGSQFMKDGEPVTFSAANAYWLLSMSDANINATMKDIASRNISLVRTFAFRDVSEIPESGPWLHLLAPNGSMVFNNGSSGAGRLRSIFAAAEENNLMVQLVLTNNWSAFNISNLTITLQNGTQVTNPSGSYSNDYGGADSWVQFNNLTDHTHFYANSTVIDSFTNGLASLIPQFASHTNLFAWELANDPRCNGTLQDPELAAQCDTTTISRWHQTVSARVKELDPNHLITSGTGGTLCQTGPQQCPKLFFTPAPTPTPSPAPGLRRRSLTEKGIIAERISRWKRTAEAAKQQQDTAAEKRARGAFGKWRPRSLFGSDAAADPSSATVSRHVKRQSMTVGSANDGSFGVDSLDIAAIQNISFLTFQLLPDQTQYEVPDPSLPAFNNTINVGAQWIETQAMIAHMVKKPTILTSFGLVTQENAPFFIPSNGTSLTFPNSSAIPTTLTGSAVGILAGQAPVNETVQALAYEAWLESAIKNGISGISVNQWGVSNLQPAPPTPTQAIGPASDSGTFSPALPATQGVSPDDGYQAISPQIQAVIQAAALNIRLANSIQIPLV